MKKLLYIIITLLLFSCSNPIGQIEKESLFSLDLGKMEHQIDLVYHKGYAFPDDTYIYMKKGFFYIANGSLKKVVEFTTYGDILTSVYNPDFNPQPVSLVIQDEEMPVVNKKAFPFHLNSIGPIVLDSQKTLYVVDQINKELRIFNEELGIFQEDIIRRFDKDGIYHDFIGREGIKGNPLSTIHSIHILENDELAVVTILPDSAEVLLFSPSGDFIQSAVFEYDAFRRPDDKNLIGNLDSIQLNVSDYIIYLKVDYFYEKSTEINSNLYGSFIHSYNMSTNKYINETEIPRIIQASQYSSDIGQNETSLIYSFLGVTKGPLFFLYNENNEEYIELIILNNTGRVIKTLQIALGEEEIIFQTLHLSPEGLISGLLLHEFNVEICWWRSDKYIKDIKNAAKNN